MSNTYFSFKQFTVRQEHCAMKVGTDGTLLGAWADVPATPHPAILDIGTGTGLIALMMAQRFPRATVRAIDIDAGAAAQAAENALASPFAKRVSVECMDVNALTGCAFDAIVCNPPYFTEALKCPDDRRTVARHADTLTAEGLMAAATRLLTPGGELSIVIPDDAAGRMLGAAAIAGLFVRRICRVKTTERKPPKRCLMAFTNRHVDADIEEDTIVIGGDKYACMLDDFYL